MVCIESIEVVILNDGQIKVLGVSAAGSRHLMIHVENPKKDWSFTQGFDLKTLEGLPETTRKGRSMVT